MPMEQQQVLRHYEKDSLKMAMLKHEETFRQQVHDLHRLYRIQKLLMRDLKREINSQSQQRSLSASPNGSPEYNHGASALDMRAYEQWYGATRAAATPRAALRLDVAQAVEYAQSAEETDDEAELELTLAVGSGGGGGGGGGGAKKRYSNERYSAGESFSSSSTESDTPTDGGLEWPQQAQHQLVGAGSPPPYRKRRPAGFDVVQVEGGGVQQPSPLRFHWLSLRMA